MKNKIDVDKMKRQLVAEVINKLFANDLSQQAAFDKCISDVSKQLNKMLDLRSIASYEIHKNEKKGQIDVSIQPVCTAPSVKLSSDQLKKQLGWTDEMCAALARSFAEESSEKQENLKQLKFKRFYTEIFNPFDGTKEKCSSTNFDDWIRKVEIAKSNILHNTAALRGIGIAPVRTYDFVETESDQFCRDAYKQAAEISGGVVFNQQPSPYKRKFVIVDDSGMQIKIQEASPFSIEHISCSDTSQNDSSVLWVFGHCEKL